MLIYALPWSLGGWGKVVFCLILAAVCAYLLLAIDP